MYKIKKNGHFTIGNKNNDSSSDTPAGLHKQRCADLDRILDTKFQRFVTGDHIGMESQIASDRIDRLVDILNKISLSNKFDLDVIDPKWRAMNFGVFD
ncbi:MAG: hypothetical protein OXG88_07490 [Gammaproteobacteria bacterium]|nr:hypothetical protein [Gammaproteobacteria bacterium]